MRSVPIIVLLALAACGEAAVKDAPADGQAAASPSRKIDRARAGSVAPAAAFVDRAGVARRLPDFAGRPVLVNLWATWCAPCIAEMPALDRLAKRGAGRLAVVTISQDLEGWRAVDRFFKPGRYPNLTPYLDQPNAWPIALGAQGLPVSILYDARGREIWRVAGPLEWDALTPEALARL